VGPILLERLKAENYMTTYSGLPVYIGYASETGCKTQTVRRDGVKDAALATRDLTDKQKMEDEMNWYLMVLKKYAQFDGRSRRKEYWMFALFNCIICLPLYILGLVFREDTIGLIFLGLYFIYVLAILIPGLAVTVRRLHDTGKSGWMILLCLIPIVGGIIVFVFTVLDSDPGVNKYGPNPKGA
jgi:uncharacterized membrane protein YhaH (DUF805 family)